MAKKKSKISKRKDLMPVPFKGKKKPLSKRADIKPVKFKAKRTVMGGPTPEQKKQIEAMKRALIKSNKSAGRSEVAKLKKIMGSYGLPKKKKAKRK